MTIFDRALSYQFGVIWKPGPLLTPIQLGAIAERISAPVEGVGALGLKFTSTSPWEASFSVPPTFQVSGQSSVWRLVVAQPFRVDVFFNARAYQDIKEEPEPTSLALAQRRVLANLLAVTTDQGRAISRVLVILAGEASATTVPQPVKPVADRFFSEKIRQRAVAQRVPDLGARTNDSEEWQLRGAADSVRVNRFESGTAYEGLLPNGKLANALAWEFDVNTSPTFQGTIELGGAEDFFARATDWIESQRAEVERLCRSS